MDISYGSRTDVGCYRELNEDAVFARPPLFVVADGMGGHAAGETAAALAVERLSALAVRSELGQADVAAAVSDANTLIVEHEAQHPETAGMGTTVTGICLGAVGDALHWFVFNVGDSRVYRLAGSHLTQVTVDHSEVAELVAAGRISLEESRSHPLRNVVTRSLGTRPPPVPDIWMLPVTSAERFLVCSDGLSTEVTDQRIAELLGGESSPQAAADALVEAALAGGGRDNVSVIVVDSPDSGSSDAVDVATAPRHEWKRPR